MLDMNARANINFCTATMYHAAMQPFLFKGGGEGYAAVGSNRCRGQEQCQRQRCRRQCRRQFNRCRRCQRRRGWTITADPINFSVIYLERDGQVGQTGVAQHRIICKQQSVCVYVYVRDREREIKSVRANDEVEQ